MNDTVAAPAHSLDSIVDHLDRFHQRATYGAVARILNRPPRNLMSGRERNERSSWIVSRENGLPTGYAPEQTHPQIAEREKVLDTGEGLSSWLQNPA
ncbi:MAG: hypothetical protein ABI681_07945 [Gemmatimonadales bacterium]